MPSLASTHTGCRENFQTNLACPTFTMKDHFIPGGKLLQDPVTTEQENHFHLDVIETIGYRTKGEKKKKLIGEQTEGTKNS